MRAVLIGGGIAIVVLVLGYGRRHGFSRLIASGILGVGGLYLAGKAAMLFGMSLPWNWLSGTVAAVLGLPGVALLAATMWWN